MLRWLVRTLAALDLATGVVPLVALVVVTAARGRRQPAERAFLAVTWACLGWFLVIGGLSGSWEPYGLKERYVFYLQPLLLLGLVLWAERAGTRRLRFVLPVVVAVALAVAFLPLEPLLTAGSLPGNALGMEVFHRLGNLVGFGGGLRALLVVAVVVLSLVALARRGRWLVVGLCAAFIAVASGFAARLADDQARAVATTAELPANRSWVDAAVGKDANVVLVNAANFMPETLRGDYFTVWAPWWETQFWNRSARTVDSLGSPEPLPLPQRSGTLDWATGVVTGVPPGSPVLSDPRFEVRGRRLGSSPTFDLYDRVGSPVRLASATEGVFRDGQSSAYAAYDRWAPGARRVRIAFGGGPVPVQIRVGSAGRERRRARDGAADRDAERDDPGRRRHRDRARPEGAVPDRGAFGPGERGTIEFLAWALTPPRRAAAIRASAGGTSVRSPSSVITLGSTTERISVASRISATATPKPISWNCTRSPRAKPVKTTTMISAAPVMIRAVDATPAARRRRACRGSGRSAP